MDEKQLLEEARQWLIQGTRNLQMRPYDYRVSRKRLKGYAAETVIDDTYLLTDVYLGDRFLELAPDRQKLTLCHELGHVFKAELDRVIEKMRKLLPVNKTVMDLKKDYDAEDERFTDHLASVIMPLMPLWKGV